MMNFKYEPKMDMRQSIVCDLSSPTVAEDISDEVTASSVRYFVSMCILLDHLLGKAVRKPDTVR